MVYKLIIGLVGLLLMCGCSTISYKPGEIYTIDDGEGKIGVVKILIVDPEIIHLRIYKNKFEKRPKELDPEKLSLGIIQDEDGFGIGHIPLDIQGFEKWKPELLATSEVTSKELEGYNIWKEQ